MTLAAHAACARQPPAYTLPVLQANRLNDDCEPCYGVACILMLIFPVCGGQVLQHRRGLCGLSLLHDLCGCGCNSLPAILPHHLTAGHCVSGWKSSDAYLSRIVCTAQVAVVRVHGKRELATCSHRHLSPITHSSYPLFHHPCADLPTHPRPQQASQYSKTWASSSPMMRPTAECR